MAFNRRHIAAPPSRVWAVLADPTAYRHWVVGSADIRGVDEGFPAEGKAFHHSVGVWPLRVKDNTSVREAQEPGHLKLEARARPFGRIEVDLRIVPDGEGSRVDMREEPISPGARLTHNPAMDGLIKLRNAESLRRLAALCEDRALVPPTSLRPERHVAGR